MNSAEEIAKYKGNLSNYYSPTLSRQLLGCGYELPEKSPKKEKKWSIGSLFRRKKKDESDSSSEEEPQKKGFLNRRKRKSDKKKKVTKPVGAFDHIVISRNSHLYSNGFNGHEEAGVLSDPTGGFNKPILQINKSATNGGELLDDVHNSRGSVASGSADSLSKNKRKVFAKARAEARRLHLRNGSSSDEDSQISASSSRLRSDESLGTSHREGSLNRRSRAARTERYLKRHSRDGENPRDYITLPKSDAENSSALQYRTSDESNRSLSRSPLLPPSTSAKFQNKPSYSSLSNSFLGLSTIPPSHGTHSKIRVSNSTSNPSYKPPLSMNEYNSSVRKMPNDYFNNQRSLSYDANIHKEIEPEIIRVQFPISKPNNRYRNLSLIDPSQIHALSKKQPPPPPPRDPKRLVTAQFFDNARPNSYYFDSAKSKSFHSNSPTNNFSSHQRKKFSSFNLHPNSRSTSEDHLPKTNIQLIPRPSSATPTEATLPTNLAQNPGNYNYLADKKPRSRKPIFIRSNDELANKKSADRSETQKALDFWKQKDKEGQIQEKSKIRQKSEPKSPQMFTCQTHVQTQVFLPSVLQNDINSEKLEKSRSISPFKPISPTLKSPEIVKNSNNTLTVEQIDDDTKRKSANLEEALDELEAIYNSLRLGDEDLLERAEQRERDATAERLKKYQSEAYPNWNMSRGALSDSSFSYEPFDSIRSPRCKRNLKKSQTVDRRADDMAYRKLNKERSATIHDPQSVMAKVSYLESSPFYGKEAPNDFEITNNKKSKEPDVTLDDVVYRNVKYANNTPKVIESQPPFGIPLGPISSAANSDYLHAVPENVHRPAFKPRKIPDLVKDDLAFRNLRKDENKEPALPPLSPDDLRNNNALETKLDLNSLKKRRAVRSLSANISSLINRDALEQHKINNNQEKDFKTLSDIADAMEIARKVLKDKETKISTTKKAFLSDTDTNNGNCDTVKESRMNFLNSLKGPQLNQPDNYLHVKPPRGLTPDRKSPRSPKESTPIPISPLEEKIRNESRHSSLDDLITALATEARETSKRITSELKHIGEDKQKQIDENSNKSELSKKLSDIDAVSNQAKLCEKLLEGVVNNTNTFEEVQKIQNDSVAKESVANIVITRDEESDHDYANLMSDKELKDDQKCTSPFEEHKAELIASFQELKKNAENIGGPKTPENETKDDQGEDCVPALDTCARECAYVVSSFNVPNQTLYFSNCDVEMNSPQADTESSSEFHSNSCDSYPGQTNLDSLESLKSPKLVLETSKLSKQSDFNKQIMKNRTIICSSNNNNKPGTSTGTRDRGETPGHIPQKPTPDWYRDPATMAVACSYGLACAHQLASLDFVAILGILFAVLSFIAALFL